VANKWCSECSKKLYRDKWGKFKETRHEYVLWSTAKTRAKRACVPFSITEADIVIPATCPVLGIPLVAGKGKLNDGSPTLDRIIPQRGYVPGNIAVISHRANTLKSNGTAKEIEAVLVWLKEQEKRSLQ
jgi:hypothetical protein